MVTNIVRHKPAVDEYKNNRFNVYSQEVDFGEFQKKYYVAQFGHKCGLLLIKDDCVLLAHQYRFLVDRFTWEIPGGGLEENENPQISAIRECEEETGFRGLNVKPLIHYLQGMDSISADVDLFYATEFEQTKDFIPNPSEVDAIQWFSIDQVMEMIKLGKILDHFTIVGLLYYQHIRHLKLIKN